MWHALQRRGSTKSRAVQRVTIAQRARDGLRLAQRIPTGSPPLSCIPLNLRGHSAVCSTQAFGLVNYLLISPAPLAAMSWVIVGCKAALGASRLLLPGGAPVLPKNSEVANAKDAGSCIPCKFAFGSGRGSQSCQITTIALVIICCGSFGFICITSMCIYGIRRYLQNRRRGIQEFEEEYRRTQYLKMHQSLLLVCLHHPQKQHGQSYRNFVFFLYLKGCRKLHQLL